MSIDVVAAFDQNVLANETYQANFGLTPRTRNLDALDSADIPAADLWWLSPPCTPFSRRGNRRDDQDPRALSFLNLISSIPDRLPQTILVENVSGFAGSKVHARLCSTLYDCEYTQLEVDLCPTQFGVPMRRPRHFVVASRVGIEGSAVAPDGVPVHLASFLDPQPSAVLLVEEPVVARYGQAYDVVDPTQHDAQAICFTSGYYKCQKASGSFITMPDGRLRRFSPREILNLLGFSDNFHIPDHLPLPAQWRLVGNSVDVRAIRYLLAMCVP